MWAYLSPPDSNLQLTIAAWTTVVAGATTLVLFCYTLALRFATVTAEHRRRAVVARWRAIFAAAILSETEARQGMLPRYARRERADLLEEWNLAMDSVDGDAIAHLIVTAERLGFNALAHRMLQERRLSTRLLALQTLGHLRDRSQWSAMLALLEHANTALSITAAEALVEIDARDAMPLVMPHAVRRVDWPQATVSRIFKRAGPELVTQPLCNAILTSDSATAVRLLRYTWLARTETVDQLVELILRERHEPAVLTAAMKAVSSEAVLPGMARLAAHDMWHVRMQAAKLLGRVGQERDLPLLERLLADREWWVRYRAAQAIVGLPFMGPNALRRLRERQKDLFAGDMLQQAMAEVGLA